MATYTIKGTLQRLLTVEENEVTRSLSVLHERMRDTLDERAKATYRAAIEEMAQKRAHLIDVRETVERMDA